MTFPHGCFRGTGWLLLAVLALSGCGGAGSPSKGEQRVQLDSISAELESLDQRRADMLKAANLGEDWFLDAAQREQVAPAMLPIERRRLALLEEEAARGNTPLAPEVRANAYLRVALLGGAEGETALKQRAEAKNEDAWAYISTNALLRIIRGVEVEKELGQCLEIIVGVLPRPDGLGSKPASDAKEDAVEDMIRTVAECKVVDPKGKKQIYAYFLFGRTFWRVEYVLKGGIPNAKEREAMRASVLPLGRRAFRSLEEMAALNQMGPADTGYLSARGLLLIVLSAFGDKEADPMLDVGARSDDATIRSTHRCAQLAARWLKSDGNSEEQTKILDALREIAKADPNANGLPYAGIMLAYGAATPQLQERLESIVAGIGREKKQMAEDLRKRFGRKPASASPAAQAAVK